MDTLNEDPNLTSFFISSSALSKVATLNKHSKRSASYGLQDLSDMIDCSGAGNAGSTFPWFSSGSFIQRLKVIVAIFGLVLTCLWCPSSSQAAQVTLAWDSVTDADLADYRIYARIKGKAFGNEPLWVGDASSCTISGLDDDNSYCFVVRAANLSGIESSNSNETCYQADSDDKPDDGGHSDDTDGDGMPDAWETAMGLDPTIDDSKQDADGDGISNLDEYNNGSDPNIPADNLPPDAPEGHWPVGGAIVESLTPELSAEAYYDEDDLTKGHLKSQWRIIRSYDNFTVFDATSENYLTDFRVPNWVLEPETDYYWQVRFYDELGAASPWSSENDFVTPLDMDDMDGNGIPDYQEIDENQDLNKDGIPDVMQPDTLKCMAANQNNSIVGIGIGGVQGNNLISGISNGDVSELVHSLTDTTSLPYGLFEYKIEVTEPGATIEIEIFLPESAPYNAKWYQLGVERNWIDYEEYSKFSSDRKTITLELKDGGYGDIDGIENSVIVDRSGLMLAPQSSGGNTLLSPLEWGGSGACFVNSLRKANDIERFYLWLAGAGIAMMLLGKVAAFWRGKLPRTK